MKDRFLTYLQERVEAAQVALRDSETQLRAQEVRVALARERLATKLLILSAYEAELHHRGAESE